MNDRVDGMTAIDKRKLSMIAEDVATDIAFDCEGPGNDGLLMLGGQK